MEPVVGIPVAEGVADLVGDEDLDEINRILAKLIRMRPHIGKSIVFTRLPNGNLGLDYEQD